MRKARCAAHRCADAGQEQRYWRRCYGEPSGYEVRRHFVRPELFSLKQIGHQRGMLGKHLQTLHESQRVCPVIWMQGVHRGQRRRYERSSGRQNAPSLGPVTSAPKVQRAHRQHDWRQQQAEDAQVACQTHGQSTERKGSNRLPAKRPMREMQRDHEHHRERNVLAVEKRVRIQTGMQQKHEHRQHGQPSAAEHAVGQQAAEECAEDEKTVRQQVAHEVNVTAVAEAQGPLGQQQRHLDSYAVVAVMVFRQGVRVAQDVIGVEDGELALFPLIPGDAVVIEHRHAKNGRDQAHRSSECRERSGLQC